MSARKLRRMRDRKKLKFNFSLHIPKKITFSIGLALSVFLFVFVYSILVRTTFWDGENKLAVAVNDGEGASVLLFDPQYDEVVTIKIPKNTEVEVARQLGIWKIQSIWELGEQEKVAGELLADSLTKHFHFPTAAWADKAALGLASGSIGELYRAVFGIYDSNLSIGDKFAMAWFSFNVSNAKRVSVDLEDSGYIIATTLLDGTKGYKKVEPPPQRILALFADSHISQSTYAVAINDATGQGNVAENVGQVVEVLGAKVAALDNYEVQDVDCVVTGNNRILVEQVSKLFDCSTEKSVSSFDLEILLGKKFAQRF